MSPGHKIQPYLEAINSPLKTATDYKAHPDSAGKKKPGYIAHLQKQLDSLSGGTAPPGNVVKTADQIKVGDLVHGHASVHGGADFGTADHPVVVSDVVGHDGAVVLKSLDKSLSPYVGSSILSPYVGSSIFFAPTETLTVHGTVAAETAEISKLADQTVHYNLFGLPVTKDQLVVMKPYVDAGDMVSGFHAIGSDWSAVDVAEQADFVKQYPNNVHSVKAKFYELFAQAKGDDNASQVIDVFGYKFPLGVARQIHDGWAEAIAAGPKFGKGGVDTYTSPFGFENIIINPQWNAATTGEIGSTQVFMDELGKTVKAIDAGSSTVVIAGHEFDPNILQAVVDKWKDSPPKTWSDALDTFGVVGSPLPIAWQSDLIDAATADTTSPSILANLMTQVNGALPKVEAVVDTNTVTVMGKVMSKTDAQAVLDVMDGAIAQGNNVGAVQSFAAAGVPLKVGDFGPYLEAAKAKYGTTSVGKTVHAALKDALGVVPVEPVDVFGWKVTPEQAAAAMKDYAVGNPNPTVNGAGFPTIWGSLAKVGAQQTSEQYKGVAYITAYDAVQKLAKGAVPTTVTVATKEFSVGDAQKLLAALQYSGKGNHGEPLIATSFILAGLVDPFKGQYSTLLAPLKNKYPGGVGQALQKEFESVLTGIPAVPVSGTVEVLGATIPTDVAQKILGYLEADPSVDPYIAGAFDQAGVNSLLGTMDLQPAFSGQTPAGVYVK